MKKILIVIALLPVLAFAALNFFAPHLIFDGAMQLTRSAAGMETKQIKLGQYNYSYLDSGESSKPTILFIHGFGAEKDNWTRMGVALKGDYRLVALDLLGHGESDKPLNVSYKISDQVERVNAFVDAMKLDSLHLIGNSMGILWVCLPRDIPLMWLRSPS